MDGHLLNDDPLLDDILLKDTNELSEFCDNELNFLDTNDYMSTNFYDMNSDQCESLLQVFDNENMDLYPTNCSSLDVDNKQSIHNNTSKITNDICMKQDWSLNEKQDINTNQDGDWFPHSPSTSDDMSDTTNEHDLCSETQSYTSSPPPSYEEVSKQDQKPVQLKRQRSRPSSSPAMLPFALPVAWLPMPQQATKRSCPTVLPYPDINSSVENNNPSSDKAAPLATKSHAAALVMKKSKREIRQMKNRESANKSRLRRKNQLKDLETEVSRLNAKQNELQSVIAALKAENKALLDHNSFLRSLVSNNTSIQLPAQLTTSLETLKQTKDVDILEQGETTELLPHNRPKRARITNSTTAVVSQSSASRGSTRPMLSATSLGLCATVFGLTVLADMDAGASPSGATTQHIRRSGRVLYSLAEKSNVVQNLQKQHSTTWFQQAQISTYVEALFAKIVNVVDSLQNSPFMHGILLNVLSFLVIAILYHMWQTYANKSHPLVSKKTTRAFVVVEEKTEYPRTSGHRKSKTFSECKFRKAAGRL